ncbi:MAG: glutamine--fructose-6-phosphate transaminase (isomerizing) [Desulfovibrio sp.]|jgi:glucosamine--fructose-6-phosphate aminotransferase (isomerizing)|nr:glutamine--fructose-6-phosphate transaminase (isomerizing) [Desulfovibrio sp.]
MCGIIGYSGHRPAVPVIMEGLRRLEYRGYDSSGVCFVRNRELQVIRAEGKLNNLEDKLADMDISLATAGLGHTRWATHGAPTENNAHPHVSFTRNLAIVHNGIIENYREWKDFLLDKGYLFFSETDTEVLANLIADEQAGGLSLLRAFAAALEKASGTYAVALLSTEEPDTIYAARHSAPLLIGAGAGEHFAASDIPAFLPYTRDVVFLEDGEIARITPLRAEVFSMADLKPVPKTLTRIEWDLQAAQKGGYKHFMLKEIFEQPRVVADCIAGRADTKRNAVRMPELEGFPVPSRLRIAACGTSWHAGLWAQSLMEGWSGIPTTVETASEFRYRNALPVPGECLLVISQSGETADTLAALRLVKEQGIATLGICNVIGSSIAREADAVVLTQAGPEISVASTKAMTAQMTVLMLTALYWGRKRGSLDREITARALAELSDIPARLTGLLPTLESEAAGLAARFAACKSMFFLGRGQSFPLALEGALKVKELSYIHAEGYASGEMKHGPIALIDPCFPSFFLMPYDAHFAKTMSNLEEVAARKGPVVALTNPPKDGMELRVGESWLLPEAWGPLCAFFMLPALQLFSYKAAAFLGKDVDQPRNLAKSVTVE